MGSPVASEHLHRQLLSPITQRSFRSCHWGWFHSVTRTIALAATFLYSGVCTPLLVAVLAHMCTSNLASLRLRLGVLSMAALPVHHQGATGGGSIAACRTAGLPAGAALRLRGSHGGHPGHLSAAAVPPPLPRAAPTEPDRASSALQHPHGARAF